MSIMNDKKESNSVKPEDTATDKVSFIMVSPRYAYSLIPRKPKFDASFLKEFKEKEKETKEQWAGLKPEAISVPGNLPVFYNPRQRRTASKVQRYPTKAKGSVE